jgi:uncharacterized protein (DUF58 family)
MPLPALRLLRLRPPWLRRAVALGRRAVDLFPFTPLGLVTLGAAALALVRYGVARVDLLYLVIGAVGLGIGALSLLASTLTAVGIRLGLRGAGAPLGPLRLECGVPTPTGFSLPALGYVPIVHARWSWTRPAAAVRVARERGRLLENVTPARRGLEESIERRIEVSDAFALTRIAFLHREPRPVRAVPSAGALSKLQLSRSIAGGDETYDPEGVAEGERVDVRGYAAGDPIRFILWKVFAKSRQLVVRTPERALEPARRSIAYVVTGRGDEAAAGVARRAVDSGALGASFVIGADGVAEDARTAGEALDLLARSAGAEAEAGGAGLGAFLQRASAARAVRAIVFVPAFRGPWVERVVAAARGGRGSARARLQVVVCTNGMDRERPRSLLKRLLLARKKGEARPEAREVEALVALLAAAGGEVLLVDRAHGQVYAGSMRGRPLQAARPRP